MYKSFEEENPHMPKYIFSFERPDLQQKSCELYLKYSFGSAV